MAELYKKDGFRFLEGVFDLGDVQDFENSILDLACALLKQVRHSPIPKDPYEILRTMETNYKDEFFTLCSQVGTCSAGWSIASSERLRNKLKEIAGPHAPSLFVQPIGVFYNQPDVKRLHTAPHQEASYFPGVRNGHHCWFPLFRDLSDVDGPLIVYKGSHVEHFPYSVTAKPRSITQLTTPFEIVEKFEPILCSIKRGDAVLFDHHCVHSTAHNSSGLPRVSAVIRFVNLVDEVPFKPWVQFAYHNTSVKDEISKRQDPQAERAQ